jgi:hypothetical protein
MPMALKPWYAPPGARGRPPLAEKRDAVMVIGLCGGLTKSLPTSGGSFSRMSTKTVSETQP